MTDMMEITVCMYVQDLRSLFWRGLFSTFCLYAVYTSEYLEVVCALW